MSENEDIDELLYTQEDINEWMRACDELQENLLDKREIIKDLQSQLDQQKAMWNELKEFIIKKQEEYQADIIEQEMQGSIPNSISFYARYNLCNEIQKKMQELEGEDE